ncbi:IclR family transcriptional regulator domain-containing protein [Streptomyces virginiae]|uniref:IclR-ED domain-containing protein n=1 Tax=Streptomyces virginiae TaxID=1961 RepID=A0ABZ1TR08_STRVG|nr:IclR family transcriptional regulator C-terminal domain-containing protein [Streptomyces virginiae]
MSRNDSGRGTRRGQYAPDGFAAVLSELKGPKDYWDRPDGKWGLLVGAGALERRQHANSCYRMGSRALRGEDWQRAMAWLMRARAERHPGAAFRLAVVLWRTAGDCGDRVGRGQDVVAAVMDAARFGHGDAQRLLEQSGWSFPSTAEKTAGEVVGRSDGGATAGPVAAAGGGVGGWQDPQFAPAVAEALVVLRPAGPRQRAGQDVAAAEAPAPVRARYVPEKGFTPLALRSPGVTALAQQVPKAPPPRQWESALRVLDVLDVIGSWGRPVSTRQILSRTSLPRKVLEGVLFWLCRQGLVLRLADGAFTPGPILRMMGRRDAASRPENLLVRGLNSLRDAAGAAVYVSTYAGGEIAIKQYADGPGAPKVHEWVDFKATAHASAVGKSLLHQLDFDSRMDHLARWRTVPLTTRTITDLPALFRSLDTDGPHALQFDLLEYSDREVCVAVPLGFGGRAGSVAFSLPVAQKHRLLEVAKILSDSSTGLLLSLLLAADPLLSEAEPRQQSQAPVPSATGTMEEDREEQDRPTAARSAPASPPRRPERSAPRPRPRPGPPAEPPPAAQPTVRPTAVPPAAPDEPSAAAPRQPTVGKPAFHHDRNQLPPFEASALRRRHLVSSGP